MYMLFYSQCVLIFNPQKFLLPGNDDGDDVPGKTNKQQINFILVSDSQSQIYGEKKKKNS